MQTWFQCRHAPGCEDPAAVASLWACEEQSACRGEEGDANPCHGRHARDSCAAKDPTVRNQHEGAQNDDIEDEVTPAAVHYAEVVDSDEARNCSRPPYIQIAPD